MNKMYKIIYVETNSVIVINLTYYTISYFLPELEKELGNNSFQGNILFDLLLSNGLCSRNRFLATKFFNRKIDDSNIQIKNEVEPLYLKKISNFYKKNIAIIESGILQESEIASLRRQLMMI